MADRKEIAELDNMILNIRHLSKSFGTHEVLRDIDFTVNKGERFALVGPSGGGKTTICHLIPNFYKIEKGEMKPSVYKVLPFEMANEAQDILERCENIGKVVLKVCDC